MRTHARRIRLWLAIAIAAVMLGSSTLLVYRQVMRSLYPIHYGGTIAQYAAQAGVDPFLVAAIIRVESGFNNNARSSKGALGLMQIVPKTARWIASSLNYAAYTDGLLKNPQANIRMGTWYFAQLHREFGSRTIALAAYNAGRGNVRAWLTDNRWSGAYGDADKIPFLETRVYVRRITNAYSWYRRIYKGHWPI